MSDYYPDTDTSDSYEDRIEELQSQLTTAQDKNERANELCDLRLKLIKAEIDNSRRLARQLATAEAEIKRLRDALEGRNISITKKEDGHWLEFRTACGDSACLRIESLESKFGPVTWRVIMQWAIEQALKGYPEKVQQWLEEMEKSSDVIHIESDGPYDTKETK